MWLDTNIAPTVYQTRGFYNICSTAVHLSCNVIVPNLPAGTVSYKIPEFKYNFIRRFSNKMVRDSAFGTAAGYKLGGPGIDYRWRRDFPHS